MRWEIFGLLAVSHLERDQSVIPGSLLGAFNV